MKPFPEPIRGALLEGGRGLTILCIRLGAMGDILRTLPAVRRLRTTLPRSRIVWLADDTWARVLDGHPDLDAVVALPRRELRVLGRKPSRWNEWLDVAARWRADLRDVAADIVLDFHGNLRSAMAGLLSGAPVRLGYEGHQQKEGNRLTTTHRVPAGDRRASRMDRNLRLVEALGARRDPLPDGGLTIDPAARRDALAMVADAGLRSPYAVISPGASAAQAYKRPPIDLLAEAATTLGNHGVESLAVYGPGEEADAHAVVEASAGAARLAPPTTLPQLQELLRDASMFVGGDTGPMHLACAVGCPVVAIYGPTDPAVNAPWGVPHRAVFPAERKYTGIKRIDREAGGFDGLAPPDVAEAVEHVLEEARRAPSDA